MRDTNTHSEAALYIHLVLHCSNLVRSEQMIRCRLKRLLAKKGMTRYELQKLSGITYATLSSMYHDKSKSYDSFVLDRLCRYPEVIEDSG
jgi:DNA-binding Xre family transcriptional regulator